MKDSFTCHHGRNLGVNVRGCEPEMRMHEVRMGSRERGSATQSRDAGWALQGTAWGWIQTKNHLPPWVSSSSLFASGSSSEDEEANSCVTRTGALDKRVMVGHLEHVSLTPRKHCDCPRHHHCPHSRHVSFSLTRSFLCLVPTPRNTDPQKYVQKCSFLCCVIFSS